MKKLFGLYLVLALLSACATTNNSTAKRVPFPVAEYAALRTNGSGVISGQVFVETKHGDVLAKAGAKVVLNPVTSYSTQWYQETAVMKHPLESADARMPNYIKEELTDTEGRFEFTNVPAGEYYVSSPLVWEGPWPVRAVAPLIPQGRFVVQKILIHENEKMAVSLKCRVRLDEDSIDVSQPSIEKMQHWTSLTY